MSYPIKGDLSVQRDATVGRRLDARILGLPAWTTASAYLAGDLARVGTEAYVRLNPGTARATFDATEAAEWRLLGLDVNTTADGATLVPGVYSTGSPAVATTVTFTPPAATADAWYGVINTGPGTIDVAGTLLTGVGAAFWRSNPAGTGWVLISQSGTPAAVITQAQITNPLDTTPGLITGQRVIQAGNAYHDATVIYQASGSLDFDTVHTAGPLGNPLFQGAFGDSVNLSHAPMGAALGADGIWYYTGSTTDGTIDLTMTDSRQVSYHAHRDLVGGVWSAWSYVNDSDWVNTGNNWQVTSGMSVVIGDGHNLTVTHIANNGAGIRLVPASDWSQVGTITPTVTSWPFLGTFPTSGRQMVTLAPDPANSRWIVTMGGTLRDVTPAALPADLAALTTAVPPAGEPGPRSWIARYGTAPDIQIAGIEGGAWVALGAAADTQAVTEQTTGASPTVGRLNIYPSGAAIGPAPAVVTDGEYSTAIMDASGTTYGPITRWVEVGGQWRNQTAVAAAAGTIHYGRYHWENYPLNTVGGTASSLAQEQQFGTAITRNGAASRVQLAQGFTYNVRIQVTRGFAEANWVHLQPKWNIGGGDVNVPTTAFYFGDDESNWQGGGAVEFFVAVPSANAAPATVWLERTGSGGNGNTAGDIIVTAIAQESGAGLPAAWPQRLVTCSVDGVAGTFNTRANVVGYDGQTMLVDIDIPAGRSITSIAGSTLNGGAADIAVGFAGLINVTPNSGNMHLTCVTGVAETFNSWQRVVTVAPNLAVTAADQTINMGVTLVEGDELRIVHRFNSSATEESSGHVAVRAGTTQRHAFWPDTSNGLHLITFPATLGTTFTIRQNTAGSAPRILAVELWRNSANGYNVPVGTTVATPRAISATVNGSAGLVEGATSAQGFEAIGKEVRITMPAGHRLDVLTPPGGGATAEITNQLTGTIYVVPGPGPVVLAVTTVLAATYQGQQRTNPTFLPPTVPTDIANTTFNTGVDLRNAGIQQIQFHCSDPDGTRWPVATLDLRATRANGDMYYVWNYDTSHLNVYIDNYATGAIRITDTNRNAVLWAIDFLAWGPVGYTIPTGTATAIQRAVTVNGGAVQVNGAASVNILEGVGAYHLQAALPAGKWVDAAAFATANAAKGATLIDRRTGEFSIQIPTGGAAVDITMAFVDHTEVGAALTLTGSFNHIDGAHSNTDLTGLAVLDNEGSGLSIGTDSVITITRDMILACGLTIDTNEGAALVIWPRIQLDRNDGDGLFVVSEDNHGNPASGQEQWTTQYGPFRAKAGSRLKFDSRVNGPYPGGRNGTLWIRELAADNGAVLAPGTTLATAHNITATVDGAAATVDGAAAAVAYQQIGKVVRVTLPANRQLDGVTASGGAIVARIDPLGGTVYVVAGTADSVLTCTTVPAATYQGLQFRGAWDAPGGFVDVENLTVNTGIDLRTVDWLVVHYADTGNDRRWPVIWLPISRVADNVDQWTNGRDTAYGRWQCRNRTTGQLWFEDDSGGSIQINRIEAWSAGPVGFVVPTATTLHTGRTITVAPGAQVVQGLEGVWTTIRLNAKTAAQQITSISSTGGSQVDIIDAARGIIAVQPGAANTDVTCTLGPVGALDFIRVAGSQDLAGQPYVVFGNTSASIEATIAIPSAGIWLISVACSGFDDDTSSNIACRVDLLDVASQILDSTVTGLGAAHTANAWLSLGTAFLRASLPSAGNYRVRLSNTASGELNGLGISQLIAERR